MESLASLKARKEQLEKELAAITVKKSTSVNWAPGIQDQFKSESYSYEEYTDPTKAFKLKDQISYINNQILTYAQRAKQEAEMQEALKSKDEKQYTYNSAGKVHSTNNPAIAARYDAQQRLFGMNKLQQTLMAISGQKRKFKKLWIKANTTNEKTQEQLAHELNKMFR